MSTAPELPGLHSGIQAQSNGHDAASPFVHPAGEYLVVRLSVRDPLSVKIFPDYVARCLSFADRMNAPIDKIWLGRTLYQAFAEDLRTFLMLAGIDTNSRIVAHAFAYPEVYGSLGWTANILEIEKDVQEPKIMEVGFGLIRDWAKSLNLKTVLFTTDCEARMRLFGQWGFKQYRIIGRADLEVAP